MHDVVAHHLALANAQAGTAEHLALINPPQTQQILHDLTGTTSSALRELKATLGLLRQTGDEGSAPPEPAPGLARLPELVSSCASAGITVTVATEGGPQPLSPGVDLTAFRIVQEALTNVTKHAATQTAHVRFVYSGTRLLITVTDEGPPTAVASGPVKGFGVMGMRERAHSIGGELRAGPRPEGGFEVSTALPLRPSVSGEETA
ncbi:UNVERIFIED_CONTAM: signal transduction histidine kinase [Streptomyces canus]